jgi:hypothetical protein
MVAICLAVRWLASIWDNPGSLEFAAALSTIILIGGAVIEDWPKLKQIGFLTAKLVILRCNSFERCVLEKLILHSTGALLVVVGIAGELVFETRTFIVEDREATAANLEIARLTERTKELEQQNLVLQKQAGDAKQSAVDAAGAATTAKDAAEDAIFDLTKLRAETGARRLTSAQQEQLRSILASLPTPIGIGFFPTDSEARDLAGDFSKALLAANWKNVFVNWIPNGRHGLFIGFTDSEARNIPQVKLLRDALKKIGMPAQLLQVPIGDKSFGVPAQSHVLYLLIGDHPPVNSRLMPKSSAESKTAKPGQ